MKNITVSVDEETHRLARIRAAELDTSVSALVREYLQTLADGRSSRSSAGEAQGLHGDYLRRLDCLFADWDSHGIGLRGYGRLTRDELYDRQRAMLDTRAALAEERNQELESAMGCPKNASPQA